MVKDPFGKWDRVDTVCALLVDLGQEGELEHKNSWTDGQAIMDGKMNEPKENMKSIGRH